MKKRLFLLPMLLFVLLAAMAQRREIHILSVNDMHAKLENMPRLAAIVDSLRATDPQLLVFAAGDNRTGNPYNDQFKPTSFPMVAFMNFIGFDASAYGNHEFDSRPEGLAKVIALSNFPYLCANLDPMPQKGINHIPYKVFNIDGISIGVLGVVQLGTHGLPDTHPNNVRGFPFKPVEEAIAQYAWLTKKCDVNILLSHIGYEEDVRMAARFPYYDLIIGGHSHTQLKGGEMHNGVLITQNVNRLKKATLITFTVDNGKVVAKEAKNIDVEHHSANNVVANELFRFFNENEAFKRKLAVAETPFANNEELGMFMCDAIRSEGKADIAVWNEGGVRLSRMPAGPITVNQVLTLDPFGNPCIEMNITGKELYDLMKACYVNDENRFPLTSSNITCTITIDKANQANIKRLVISDDKGKPLDMKKTYRVVMNSYVASICDSPRKDQGRDTNLLTADMIIAHLEKVGKVSYAGKRCRKMVLQ